jgi:hypothetical protein
MSSKLFFAVSLGIFAGGACLYLFIRHSERQDALATEQQMRPKREAGFAAILAEQREKTATTV